MKKKITGVIYGLAILCGLIGAIGILGALAEFDFTFFVPCIVILLLSRLLFGIANTLEN